MFKEKKTKFEMNLSGTKISFDTPTNFSRDFGYPESFSRLVNIFDSDNYATEPSVRHLFSVFTLYWDYISGVLIKDKDGTMLMDVSVERLADNNQTIHDVKELENVLLNNFKATYNEVKQKKFSIILPHNYAFVDFSSGKWLMYQYTIGTSEQIAYSIPFLSTHYLTVSFQLMVNYNEERFLKKANIHIQEIMNSLKITPP